ncbi:MAG: prepilin-type N-terminal cleavage/methylation domain-containing protein [Patescibacteria group bacterium]|nr:prepilin-type N-terminal cleavage/methylation domain-containing protein [Patescibacteria group bacterium]
MELEINILTKNKNKNGFTLVELLVALAVFGLLVSALSTIAISIIKAQRKTFAIQNIQEPARYILEVINKEIRTSDIGSASGDNMPSLSITNFQGESVVYRFADNKIQRQVNGGVWQDLSPASLEITGGFYIVNESSPKRAKVTTVMGIRIVGGGAENKAEVNLQSTITPRSF